MISQACDPALLRLFTPLRPKIGHYRVCTSARPLDAVLAEGRSDGVRFGDVETLEPLDAFGSGGVYNRFALTKLYGGRRVRVAHGWRKFPDRFESVTLLSPYPDATLSHLNGGTLKITFTMAGRERTAPAAMPSRGL